MRYIVGLILLAVIGGGFFIRRFFVTRRENAIRSNLLGKAFRGKIIQKVGDVLVFDRAHAIVAIQLDNRTCVVVGYRFSYRPDVFSLNAVADGGTSPAIQNDQYMPRLKREGRLVLSTWDGYYAYLALSDYGWKCVKPGTTPSPEDDNERR